MITVLIICGLLVLSLFEKYDILLFDRRIFFPHLNYRKIGKDEEPHDIPVDVKFTQEALSFIEDKGPRKFLVQIILKHRYIRSRWGSFLMPFAETRLGSVENLGKDFVKVESKVGIPILVERKIYEVVEQKKVCLTITASGLWIFKNLKLRPDLSWLLYTEDMRRRGKRWLRS